MHVAINADFSSIQTAITKIKLAISNHDNAVFPQLQQKQLHH